MSTAVAEELTDEARVAAFQNEICTSAISVGMQEDGNRVITFNAVPGAELSYVVSDGDSVWTAKSGDGGFGVSKDAFTVTATPTDLSGREDLVGKVSSFPCSYDAVAQEAEDTVVETTVWFYENESGNTFRVHPVEGVTFYMSEGDSGEWRQIDPDWVDDTLAAPRYGEFKVKAVASPGYTFTKGEKDTERVWGHYFGNPPAELKLVNPGVGFISNSEGNFFELAQTECTAYYFSEGDTDEWMAVNPDWVDDTLAAPRYGIFKVKAVAQDGCYFGTGANGEVLTEKVWETDFGPAPTEEPTTDPTASESEEPTATPTKDADEKKDDAKKTSKKTLAKTGAGLGLAVLASGLVGSGAVLARRRNA
nr:hypothetical protein [Actinomyces sp.]